MARLTSCFKKVHKHHDTTLFCQWHLLFSVQSYQYVFPLAFSMPYLVAHTLSFPSLQNLTLFLTFHHYSFSKHTHTIALHSPRPAHPKYLSTQQTHISSWLLFSINLTPYIANIVAFSVLLKIAISFSLRHHVLLHLHC